MHDRLVGQSCPGHDIGGAGGSANEFAANNERTTIARDKIKSLQESPVSPMPENLLNAFKPQELRDLFAYLQAEIKAHPVPVPAAPPYPNKSLKAAVQASGTKAAGAPKRNDER